MRAASADANNRQSGTSPRGGKSIYNVIGSISTHAPSISFQSGALQHSLLPQYNDCMREAALFRSQTYQGIRSFFNEREYLEVDTPILSQTIIPESTIE